MRVVHLADSALGDFAIDGSMMLSLRCFLHHSVFSFASQPSSSRAEQEGGPFLKPAHQLFFSICQIQPAFSFALLPWRHETSQTSARKEKKMLFGIHGERHFSTQSPIRTCLRRTSTFFFTLRRVLRDTLCSARGGQHNLANEASQKCSYECLSQMSLYVYSSFARVQNAITNLRKQVREKQ